VREGGSVVEVLTNAFASGLFVVFVTVGRLKRVCVCRCACTCVCLCECVCELCECVCDCLSVCVFPFRPRFLTLNLHLFSSLPLSHLSSVLHCTPTSVPVLCVPLSLYLSTSISLLPSDGPKFCDRTSSLAVTDALTLAMRYADIVLLYNIK
jgi:hypothetical protein